jgi:hypothetical protein
MCGDACARWEDLHLLTTEAWSSKDSFPRGLRQIHNLRCGEASQVPLLYDLVVRFQFAKCSDIRDTVYGFRTLAADGARLAVDYSTDRVSLLIAVVSQYNMEVYKELCVNLSHNNDWFLFNRVRWGWMPPELSSAWTRNLLDVGAELMKRLDVSLSPAVDLLRGLRDMEQDWLVMAISEEEASTHEFLDDHAVVTSFDRTSQVGRDDLSRLHTYCIDEAELRPRQGYPGLSDIIYLHFSRCGRLFAVSFRLTTTAIASSIFQEIGWTNHFWLCSVTQAVHISRFFYVFLLSCSSRSGRPDSDDLASWLRLAHRLQSSQAELYRMCLCDRSLRCHARLPPWSPHIHDSARKGHVSSSICCQVDKVGWRRRRRAGTHEIQVAFQ